jgi:RNA polymerase sigma-70 factor (ECF subfamily)
VGDTREFERLVLPWLDAGYNLARWLLRDEACAQDALQDAAVKAFRHIGGLRGDDARPWFLKIVRNACFTQLGKAGADALTGLEEEALEQLQLAQGRTAPDPADILIRRHDKARVNAAIQALSPLHKEVIVLRELEELDYGEIAQIAGVPVGTVMSRLSRARARLRALLQASGAAHAKPQEGDHHE